MRKPIAQVNVPKTASRVTFVTHDRAGRTG
jgi:hypothetical protein